MAATKEDVDRWMQTAKDLGMKYVISVCDTFSYEDYPVYAKSKKELIKKQKEYNNVNMQTINEVIDLTKP